MWRECGKFLVDRPIYLEAVHLIHLQKLLDLFSSCYSTSNSDCVLLKDLKDLN